MASFTFSNLPHELALRIVNLVAQDGYRALGSLILSGHDGRSVALSTEVLQNMPLSEFMVDPKLANPGTDERSFFLRCVAARNPDACYVEGIRVVCQDGEPYTGIRILKRGYPRSLHCKFAIGIFYFALCRKRLGMDYIRNVEIAVNSFEVMDLYADQLIEYIGEVRTRTEWGLVRNWGAGFFDLVPRCLGGPCHFDNRCQNCYVFYIAMKVRQWC